MRQETDQHEGVLNLLAEITPGTSSIKATKRFDKSVVLFWLLYQINKLACEIQADTIESIC